MTYAELTVNYAQMSRLRLLTSLRRIKQNEMGIHELCSIGGA